MDVCLFVCWFDRSVVLVIVKKFFQPYTASSGVIQALIFDHSQGDTLIFHEEVYVPTGTQGWVPVNGLSVVLQSGREYHVGYQPNVN